MTDRERKLRARKRAFRKKSLAELELIIQHAGQLITNRLHSQYAGLLGELLEGDGIYRDEAEIRYEAAVIVVAEKLARQDEQE